MPSLALDGVALPLLHVSQLAAALGLPLPAGAKTPALGWDLASVLDAWCEHLAGLEWALLTAPTPSRGRSVRHLTVNTFHPVELLPGAWEDGRFDWDPDADEERERILATSEAVRDYARRVAARWTDFLLREEGSLETADPQVESPRGRISFSELIASQRWHAAYHYRQLVEFLRASQVAVPGALRLETMRELDLPAEVF